MDSLEEGDCSICGCPDHSTAKCPDIMTDEEYSVTPDPKTLARQTLPTLFNIVEVDSIVNVVCASMIPARTKFGPLVTKYGTEPVSQDGRLELELTTKAGSRVYLDSTNENECNWLSLVRPASHLDEQNCIAFQLDSQIYYSTTRLVNIGESLRVWYAKGYAKKLNKPLAPMSGEELVEEEIEASESLNIVDDADHVRNLEMLERQFFYTCTMCGDVTCNNQKELDDHINSNHGKPSSVVKSGSVRETVALPQQRQMQGESETKRSLVCKQCRFTTDSSSSLALHITSVHLDDVDTSSLPPVLPKKRVWTCTGCGVVFSNPRSLGVHKRLHHPAVEDANSVAKVLADEETLAGDATLERIEPGEEGEVTNATVMGPGQPIEVINVVIERHSADELSDSDTLSGPQQRYGRGMRLRKKPKNLDYVSSIEVDGIHDCPYCSTMLQSEAALTEHISDAHSFQCAKCHEKFNSEEDGLQRHLCREDMMVIDINAYIDVDSDYQAPHYICLCCQQRYTDPRQFYDHLVWQGTHLQCDICKGFCTTIEDLEGHVVGCTDPSDCNDTANPEVSLAQSYTCDECNLTLCDSNSLSAHTSLHTDFKCNNCDAHYHSRYGLQRHLLVCDQSQLERLSPVFACLQCNSVFPTQHGLEYHNKDHAERTFDCCDCQQSFKTKTGFEAHNCSPKAGEFSCDICEERFKTSKRLASHYIKHTLKFDCLICRKSFEKKDDLIEHSLECSAKDMLKKTGRIDCAHCQDSFTDSVDYRTHLAVHTQTQECRYCNRRFKRKNLLTSHLGKCKLRHDRLERRARRPTTAPISEIHHTCPICHKTFVRKDYYLSHECRGADGRVIERPDNMQLIADSETESPKVICYQCGKVLTSQSNLTKHLRLHGEKSNTCDICGKAFYQIHALRLHYDSVHTDKLKVSCEHCKKVLRNKYSLNQHLKQFHSANNNVYACEVCGKKFRQKGNMVKHMLAHDISRHYQCGYCNKTFKYPEQLKRHSILHTHGKTFACDLCDRRFVVQYELNKHVKEMHSNKIFACAFCNDTCRWRHTIRRHIKRKHPQYTQLADNPEYLTALQKDISEINQSQASSLELSQSHMSKLQNELGSQVATTPLVISMDSLTPEQMLELAEEQIVSYVNEEGATIHIYNQPSNESTINTLQKSDVLHVAPTQQQQLMINSQHFTINLSNGQAILTQVDMDGDTQDSNSIGTSLLRAHNPHSQVVIGQETPVEGARLNENTAVLMTTDGSLAYTTDTRQHDSVNTVNFTDITHISGNSQDDSNKMMFFNILTSNHEAGS